MQLTFQLCVFCVTTGPAGDHAVKKVTKCVTIRSIDSNVPAESPEKWVNCFNMISPSRQPLCTRSEWESANISHVLLDIDIPNQQLYHLPLLVTPAHCIYLVTFDLRCLEESLTTIHNVMKNVYALSLYTTVHGGRECPPKVLLVGMHADEVEGKSRRGFSRKLEEMLKKMPYKRLVIRPGGDEPLWAVNGEDLSLSKTGPLSCQIQEHCSWHEAEVHRWIGYHQQLQEELKGAPCILYHDLKAKVAAISSEGASLKFDEFLKFLHDYGFIFYDSVKEGEEAEKVVLLKPQYLCNLLAKVQELSKSRDSVTIADLLSSTAACIEASAKHDKWFRRICINMGLVFELVKEVHSEYVFLMGLKAGPSSPHHDSYSIPPLLLTFKASSSDDIDEECLLPSHFFAAFATRLVRALTEGNRKLNEGKQTRTVLKVEKIEQHYVLICIGSSYVHVVEQEACIEIGLQQLEVRGRKTNDRKKMQILHSLCQRVNKAAAESAKSTLHCLKLAETGIHYGFYHTRTTEDGPVEDAFGEYSLDEEGPFLQCTCCEDTVQPTTPLHEMWFEEKIDFDEVCDYPCMLYRVHITR